MRSSPRQLAVVVALAALASTPARAEKKKPGLFDFSSWDTPVGHQRTAAKELAPVPLDVTPLGAVAPTPRPLRVRFYVDRDFRRGVLRWQSKVRTELERLDHVVGPLFGVRFEVESLREWDVVHAGVPLPAVLGELEKLDEAKDVDWVVGLVTPFHGVASSVHQIGMAELSSRTFVLRAMDDAEEGRALDREFAMLSDAERDKLYGDRKAHKELVMFLHEWAHTLGALHAEDRGFLMNPNYDHRQSAFTDFEKKLIGVVLERRLADRARPFPENAELLALVEQAPREEGTAAERADLARFLRGRGSAARPRAATPEGAKAPTASPPPPALADAVARIEANDLAGATPLVFAAAKQAENATLEPRTYLRLAGAAAAVGAFTVAEAALARAGKGAPHALELLGDVTAERARVALPVGAAALGVAPDAEPRYVAEYWAAIRAVEARNAAAAEAAAARLEADFPASPGREVVACERAVAKQPAEARPHCEAALAKDGDAVRAHLALARLDAHAKHTVDAEKHLRRVMLIDPKGPDGWRELGNLYREMRSATQLAQLEQQYEALFAAPLPR